MREVFGYWKEMMNRPQSKLDSERYKVIAKALKMDYSVEDLKKAIDGVKKSPFHMGDNNSGAVHNDVSIILGDSEKIDKFIRNCDSPPIPRNKNGTPASKLTVAERNKSQVNMLKEFGKKFFLEFED